MPKIRIKIKPKTYREMSNWRRHASQFKTDIDKLRRNMRLRGESNIKSEITKQGLIDTGDMRASVRSEVDKDGHIIFINDKTYSSYQNSGVRKHVMRYLRGKTIPLIDKKTGETIFRTATDKSFDQGKWVHPGYRGKKFMEKGIQKTLKESLGEIKALKKKIFGK